jgi:hypothetical protein
MWSRGLGVQVQYGGKTYYIGQECFDKWMELLPTGTKMVKITSANDKGSYPLIKNPLTRQREKEQHEREHPVDKKVDVAYSLGWFH